MDSKGPVYSHTRFIEWSPPDGRTRLELRVNPRIDYVEIGVFVGGGGMMMRIPREAWARWLADALMATTLDDQDLADVRRRHLQGLADDMRDEPESGPETTGNGGTE